MRIALKPKARRLLFLLLLFITLAGVVIAIVGRRISTGPAAGTAFIGKSITVPTGPYLRIGTFNIDGGRGIDGKIDLERTAKSLQKLDFVGLNEVHGFLWGTPTNQILPIARYVNSPYLFVPSEKQWGHETFGNAALSDLPVKSWQRVELPSHWLSAKRNYLLTEVDWQGTALHILTTHTDWKPGGAEQFEIVRDVFLKLPSPAILMGDLNTPASSDLIKNLQQTSGVEEAIGKILDPIPGRVDWIFLRGLTTVDAGQVDTKASDHPAYWAQVKLK